MSISKRNILLLMLGIGKDETDIANGINGITRLQKFLFLLENEDYLEKIEGGYKNGFEAYKAGPYSSALYDDLEFLENLVLCQASIDG